MFVIETAGGPMNIEDEVFTVAPLRWVVELSGEDLKRMLLLRWRFSHFAELASRSGEDVGRSMYESQGSLCKLFGMASSSQPKVSKFLTKMESGGYIKVTREKVMIEGKLKPRHYIVVNDPYLLNKYGLT